MNMRYKTTHLRGSIFRNTSYIAQSLEQKIEKILHDSAPIEAVSPIIYTDRADGVEPGYNIRTDRFDIAVEAMGKIQGSKIAKRMEFLETRKVGETPSQGSDPK